MNFGFQLKVDFGLGPISASMYMEWQKML